VLTDDETLRFFADVMLGRLARRLRLAGFDTAYESRIDDGVLVARAAREGRIILTRDRRLVERRAARGALLLTSTSIDDQWLELLGRFPEVAGGPIFSRCSACNVLLGAITPEEARPRVPPHVYQTQPVFLQCPRCQRVYWFGTHVERIRRAVQGRGEG
jgi:hypothetical protein